LASRGKATLDAGFPRSEENGSLSRRLRGGNVRRKRRIDSQRVLKQPAESRSNIVRNEKSKERDRWRRKRRKKIIKGKMRRRRWIWASRSKGRGGGGKRQEGDISRKKRRSGEKGRKRESPTRMRSSKVALKMRGTLKVKPPDREREGENRRGGGVSPKKAREMSDAV